MFRGSMVALVTPMLNGEVDVNTLRDLVEFHIEAGTKAIIAAGTTGEAGTLTYQEKLLVIKTVVAQSRERIPVIAGTAANATRNCIKLSQDAMEYGVHAVLIMTPAYIKPTQEGLYQHYSQIAKMVPVPLILYNVPSRTACDLKPETVARLSTISNIIGIKESVSQIARLKEIMACCPDMDIYSGDDPSAAEWILAGAKGVISVTANVVPQLMAKLIELAQHKETEACLSLNERLQPLNNLLFVESNPIPVKWVLSQMGLIKNELRLPLTPLSSQYHADLGSVLENLHLSRV